MKTFYNFFWFLWRLWNHRNDDGGVKASKEEQDRRLDICLNCPLLNKEGLLVKLKGPRCSICGCFVYYKKLYKFEECPDKPSRW